MLIGTGVVLLVAILSTIVGDEVDAAKVTSCDPVIGSDAPPYVRVGIENLHAGVFAALLRVNVAVTADPSVVPRPVQALVVRGPAEVRVVLPKLPRKAVNSAFLCSVSWDRGFGHIRQGAAMASPGGLFPAGRRIVFLSGNGTSSETAMQTFQRLSHELAAQLRIDRRRIQFMNFSYSGNYEPLLSYPVSVNALVADHAPRYSASDVCKGVAAAAEQLRRLLGAFPADTDYDLIGHSFGGFVAAYFLASLAADDPLAEHIHSVVTLDSPVGGLSPLLSDDFIAERVGCLGLDDRLAADVRADSEAVLAVRSLAKTPRLPHFVTIGHRLDFFVHDTASHVPAARHVSLSRPCTPDEALFHGCVLRDREAIAEIVDLVRIGWRQERTHDDHGDSTLRAKRISITSHPSRSMGTAEGRLERDADVDYFSVRVPRETTYSIFVDRRGHPAVLMKVIDPRGSVLHTTERPEVPVSVRSGVSDSQYFIAVEAASPTGGTARYVVNVFRKLMDPGTRTVTVARSGDGNGTVTMVEPRISCGAVCVAEVPHGSVVRLSTQAEPGSIFGGWLGRSCGSPCEIEVREDIEVRPTFYAIRAPVLESVCETTADGRRIPVLRWSQLHGAVRYAVFIDGEQKISTPHTRAEAVRPGAYYVEALFGVDPDSPPAAFETAVRSPASNVIRDPGC